MNLDMFLRDLQWDPDKIRPLDWEVDWEDAPLKFKLYRGQPVVPLSAEVPLSLEARQAPAAPVLRDIGHLLWHVFGFTRYGQTVMASSDGELHAAQWPRRFVPSGGGLYPSELYVYLKLHDLPAGVYHYDAAHHRLILLREGNFDYYLTPALGERYDVSASCGAVFVSTLFWKNYYKYGNFAYRLQGLDAGVLMGQLLETAGRFGFDAKVIFQFLDRAVNHLLGLSGQEESVYAVIPLAAGRTNLWMDHGQNGVRIASASELCRLLEPIRPVYYQRSRNLKDHPILTQANDASMLESPRSFRQLSGGDVRIEEAARPVGLPPAKRLSYDLAQASRKRHSPEADFVLGTVSKVQLSSLLHEATASFAYENDLDEGQENPKPRVSLYGCFYHVEGIPDGAYRYDSKAHTLLPIRPGDLRAWLQQAMPLPNLNLFQVPLCMHVAGSKDHHMQELGYRGYRIAQMEAGMLVQRLLLAAAALGMGGRPLLGYDVNTCDELYGMEAADETSLIQIPVGPYRPRPRLEGSLHG